jgi:hypothetical protein
VSEADAGKDLEVEPGVIHALIKTAEPNHLEQFADGLLYCNSLSFLSDPKHSGKTWFDGDEGLVAQYLPDRVNVSMRLGDGKTLELQPSEFAAPISIKTDRGLRVFCMYAVHPGIWSHDFPSTQLWNYLNYIWVKPRIHSYGQHAAIVMNSLEFVTRVRKASVAQGLKSFGGLVKYVDLKAQHGAFPRELFGRVKHIKFADEREYRFIFAPQDNPDPMKALQLNVGSLRDIVKVGTWDDIRRTAKLKFPNSDLWFPLLKPKRLPRRYKKRLKKGQ